MKKFLKEIERQTKNTTGDETFVFAYDNPNNFRGLGVISIGDTEQQARLLAGTINTLDDESKKLLFSYLVVDDPTTFIATALSYIDEQEK